MLPVPMSVYGCHTVTKILHRLAGSSQLRERRERLLHVFLYGKRARIRILGYKGHIGEGDHCQGGYCRRTLSIASGSLLEIHRVESCLVCGFAIIPWFRQPYTTCFNLYKGRALPFFLCIMAREIGAHSVCSLGTLKMVSGISICTSASIIR